MKKISGTMGEAVFLTASRILTTISGLLVTKILSVSLNLAEYGTYSQSLLIVSLASSLIALGLGDCISYFYNTNPDACEDRRRYVDSIFAVELVMGIFVFCILCLGKHCIVVYFDNPRLGVLIPIVALRPMLENYIYQYQVLFASIGESGLIAKRHFLLSVGKLVGVCLAVHMTESLMAILLILLLLDAAQVFLMHCLYGRKDFWVKPWRPQIELIGEILRYGIPMGMYSITNVLARDIDKLVIGYFAGTEMSAIYSNCSKLLPFDILAVSIATILIPHIVRSVQCRPSVAADIFSNYLRIGYYSVWCLTCAVMFFSEEAISFLYSDTFLVGKPIFVLYLFDAMLRFSSIHLIMTAAGKTKELFVYSLVTVALNCMLSVGLYFFVGVSGPAVATLLTTGIYTILVLRKSCYILELGMASIISIKDVLSLAIKLVVGGLAIMLFKHYMIDLGVQKYIIMVIGMCVFCGYCLLVNRKQLREIWFNIDRIKSLKL